MSERIREIEPTYLLGVKIPRYECRCDCGREYVAQRNNVDLCSDCWDKRAAAEVERQARREAQGRANETLRSIPPVYRWARLGSEDLAKLVTQDAIARATSDNGKLSIVFMGLAGSGKTSLACAILRAKADAAGAVGMFVNAFAVANARSQHPIGHGEAPVVKDAMRSKVLLLDEFGADHGRNTAVAEVVHARYESQLPTLYTTGFSLVELKQRCGDGVVRRVFENAHVVVMGAKP